MPERSLRCGFITPADLGTTDPPAASVRLLLFLGRGRGRGGGRRAGLSALSQAEMIVRLLSETPRGAHSTGDIMAALRPVVGAAACYELVGGRLSDTAGTVAKLLGQA
jgi:hypothetical protein